MCNSEGAAYRAATGDIVKVLRSVLAGLWVCAEMVPVIGVLLYVAMDPRCPTQSSLKMKAVLWLGKRGL